MIKINKTGKLLLCMVALTACLFGACDDTMGGSTTTTPAFPADTLGFVANPGDTVKVSFNAAVNWKLSSNTGWCRTLDGAMNISGKSGKQVVPFVISDQSHGFTDDKAEITLWMNDEKRVIACITRRAKGYFMELRSDSCEYAAGESIVLGTSGSLSLNVKTNFGLDQLRMDYPDWLKPTREGETIVLTVVSDSLRYTINHTTDSLILFKSDSTFSQGYHVQYVGMDSKDLRVEPQIEAALIVSRDAKQCHVGSTEYTTPMTFSVEALNDCYELVSVAYDEEAGCSLLSDEARWFVIGDDHRGNISLSFTEENNGDERMAYLLALPQAVVDSLDNSADGYEAAVARFLWEEVDGKIDLKESVYKYRLIKITQEGVMNITISPETRWNLRVATDGATYCDAVRGDTLVTASYPVEAVVDSYGGYRLMCACYDSHSGYTMMDVADSWLQVTDDQKGNVAVRFDANDGNERILYLFALPLPLVESLDPESADFHANLFAELFGEAEGEGSEGQFEVKEKAVQFVIAKFTQEADEENSIKVLKRGIESIDVVKETEQAWLDMAAAKGVAANRVFRCSMNMDYKYQINPLIPVSLWDTAFPENKDRIEVYSKSGQRYEAGVEFEEEHTMMEETEGNYMLVQLIANDYKVDGKWVCYIQEDFIIYFIDNDTNYLKALVVTLSK